MHRQIKVLLKSQNSNELREGHQEILDRLFIHADESLSDAQREALTECLSLIDEGKSVEEACGVAMANAKQKAALVKSDETALANILKEQVVFEDDSEVSRFLGQKADEIASICDPEIVVASLAEGIIERGKEISGGLTEEQIREIYREDGKRMVNARMKDVSAKGITKAKAEQIFNDVASKMG